MKKDIACLMEKIKDKSNPEIIANNIGRFISDSLRKSYITFYEAYMLQFEEIKFKRMGYMQPAWNGRVNINKCLELLNQKLFADVFDETTNSEVLKQWGLEAYALNKEKRAHYIMDRYPLFLDANKQPSLLKEMAEIRNNYNKLSFDDGPYHNEDILSQYYKGPEEILLDPKLKKKYNEDKTLSEDIENLIVELNLL